MPKLHVCFNRIDYLQIEVDIFGRSLWWRLRRPLHVGHYSKEVCALAERGYLKVIWYDYAIKSYCGIIPAFNNTFTESSNLRGIQDMLTDLLRLWIEMKLESGEPIPEPDGFMGEGLTELDIKSLYELAKLEDNEDSYTTDTAQTIVWEIDQ